jgi:hypothetical protein
MVWKNINLKKKIGTFDTNIDPLIHAFTLSSHKV